MEARRNQRSAVNRRDYNLWTYIEAKWIDLANYYRSDADVLITTRPNCPHCRGLMMLSFIEPAGPGYDRRVFKCGCGHLEDIKVRIDGGPV
jgi:ribosomal protein S27AE